MNPTKKQLKKYEDEKIKAQDLIMDAYKAIAKANKFITNRKAVTHSLNVAQSECLFALECLK